MEQFDIEAFMNRLDTVGFNTLVMLNIEALDITKEELDNLVVMASEIYQSEHDGEDISVIMHGLDDATFYVAVAYENQMEVA